MSTGGNGNGLKGAIGRLALQLLVPALAALAAAVGGYVAVASQLVRLEERLNAIRNEMQLRQSYTERDISGLKKADERFGAELASIRRAGKP